MTIKRDDFDLNHPHGWMTRRGDHVRELCRDAEGRFPILGLVKTEREEGGEVLRWDLNGQCQNIGRGLELVNAPAPKRRVRGRLYGFLGPDGVFTYDTFQPHRSSAVWDTPEMEAGTDYVCIPIDHEFDGSAA